MGLRASLARKLSEEFDSPYLHQEQSFHVINPRTKMEAESGVWPKLCSWTARGQAADRGQPGTMRRRVVVR